MRISTGKSRKDMHWRVTELSWEELCKKLSKAVVTSETMAEYKAMSVADRGKAKDVGGFVGGVIEGGSRSRVNVKSRSLVTLDADYAKPEMWDNIEALWDTAMCCYSTHSHQPELPRLRYVIPLDREVTPDEYEPIARRLAERLGIEQFDVTTYETNRLMYWPSRSSDAVYEFHVLDGEFTRADEILATYDDWHDTLSWPIAASEMKVHVKTAKAQGEPTEKPGMVGLFCRTYDIPTAIETFLSDVYEPCADKDRYTFTKGSTTAGVVVYQNGTFAYSHHATDPAGGNLCNAFDLVRLHKFGDLDYKTDPTTPINKLPSYEAMLEFAGSDTQVKTNLLAERHETAKQVFAEPIVEEDESDDAWISKLTLNKKGEVESSSENIMLILDNDPKLKNLVAVDDFIGRTLKLKRAPWEPTAAQGPRDWLDEDEACLRVYLDTTYGVSGPAKISDSFVAMLNKKHFHSVRDWLNKLVWDGVPRAETLFVDYLQAEDSVYTRTVTRKWLTAAVARVMRPGCKFDNLIVLVGAQGIGKSYLGAKLGGKWFSDTLTTMQGKEAYEQLNGAWIVEISELSAMKRSEIEGVKAFISKQSDDYRAAYARYRKTNPRQNVFFGTTNDHEFLSDKTGNRRFWPIICGAAQGKCTVGDMTDRYAEQIWAEVVQWFRDGETLYLNAEESELAYSKQDEVTVLDPRAVKIEEYLDMDVPANWEQLDKTSRRNYIQGFMDVSPDTPLKKRDIVGALDIGYELFGNDDMKPWETKEIYSILRAIPGWKSTGKRSKTIYGQQGTFRRCNDED